MSDSTNIPDRAASVRQKTLAVLNALSQAGSAFELPKPPAALEELQAKLTDNIYQVLVVGEAKRGKSTFVNALIGRDILPTDVDIATSQVFRICPAERESYRLRFEDNSQQTITVADLARYGSQVMADAVGVPRLDQIIRWIEADVPAQFLPANVRILDTPGLGALYAAHAQITQRFVPQADAVIFVLDSQTPISEPEVIFVERLLELTRSIFFIQTKIDQFRKEAWQDIQKRNQAILKERFKNHLADVSVWPISSTNLSKAAQTGDADYLMVSKHKELAAALQTFLFRVGGWSRSAEAIILAGHCHEQAANVLKGRLNGLLEESRQKRDDWQRKTTERRRDFESDWGERGQKRRDLVESIRSASSLAKQDFRQALQPGGSLELAFHGQIDSLKSLEEAQLCPEAMPGEVMTAASAKWSEVCRNFQTRCMVLIGPFLTAAEMVASTRETSDAISLSAATRKPDLNVDKFIVFKSAWSDATVTFAASGVAGTVLTVAIATSWFPPLAGTIVLGASLWALIRGWGKANQRQLKEVQHKLHEHLSKLFQQVRSYFFDVDLAAGRSGRLQEYFQAVETSLTENILKFSEQKLLEANAEITRLDEDLKLDDQSRKERSDQARRNLAEWASLGGVIKGIQAELLNLDKNSKSTASAEVDLERFTSHDS